MKKFASLLLLGLLSVACGDVGKTSSDSSKTLDASSSKGAEEVQSSGNTWEAWQGEYTGKLVDPWNRVTETKCVVKLDCKLQKGWWTPYTTCTIRGQMIGHNGLIGDPQYYDMKVTAVSSDVIEMEGRFVTRRSLSSFGAPFSGGSEEASFWGHRFSLKWLSDGSYKLDHSYRQGPFETQCVLAKQ